MAVAVMPEPDLPMEHVIRPVPPWRRSEPLTECGKPARGRPVITRAAFLAKVRTQGKQRSALTTCITCWNTAARHPAWEDNPVESLLREASRFKWLVTYGDPQAASFRDELLAIAELTERHQDEFSELLAAMGSTTRLSDVRRTRKRHA